MHHLHRAVLKRIVLTWLSVSLVFLGFALVFSKRKLDKFAMDMALTTLNQVVTPGSDWQRIGSLSADQAPSHMQRLIESKNLVLRVYDSQGKLSSRAVHPDNPNAASMLESALEPLPKDGYPHFHRFDLAQQPYVQWLLPLKGKGNARTGFLEGVLVLDREALQALKTSINIQAITILVSIAAFALALYPLMVSLNRRVFRFAAELEKSHIEIVSVLGAAVAQRDTGTSTHNFRTTLYALHLAEAIGRERVDMRALIVGAFLHDVGKIGIRDSILLKEDRLTEGEFAIMRSHVEHGMDIISQSRWLQPATSVVQAHHERYDGKGYPSGLSGEEIPLEARIFSVVDVFDALTSQRSYKDAASLESALAIVLESSGTSFDPAVVAIFHSIAPELYREIHALPEPALLDRLILTTDRYHATFLEADWKSALASG